MDVRFDRPNGTFDDQAHAHGSGQVKNNIALVHHLRQKMLIRNRIENVVKAIVFFQMADILYAARREIVQDKYGVAAANKASAR